MLNSANNLSAKGQDAGLANASPVEYETNEYLTTTKPQVVTTT